MREQLQSSQQITPTSPELVGIRQPVLEQLNQIDQEFGGYHVPPSLQAMQEARGFVEANFSPAGEDSYVSNEGMVTREQVDRVLENTDPSKRKFGNDEYAWADQVTDGEMTPEKLAEENPVAFEDFQNFLYMTYPAGTDKDMGKAFGEYQNYVHKSRDLSDEIIHAEIEQDEAIKNAEQPKSAATDEGANKKQKVTEATKAEEQATKSVKPDLRKGDNPKHKVKEGLSPRGGGHKRAEKKPAETDESVKNTNRRSARGQESKTPVTDLVESLVAREAAKRAAQTAERDKDKPFVQPTDEPQTTELRTRRRSTSGVMPGAESAVIEIGEPKAVVDIAAPKMGDTPAYDGDPKHNRPRRRASSETFTTDPVTTPDAPDTKKMTMERAAAGLPVASARRMGRTATHDTVVGTARRTGKKNVNSESPTEPTAIVKMPENAGSSRARGRMRVIAEALRHPMSTAQLLALRAQGIDISSGDSDAEKQGSRKKLLGVAVGAVVLTGVGLAAKVYLTSKGMSGGGSSGAAEQATDAVTGTGAPAPEVPPVSEAAPVPPLPATGTTEAGETIIGDIQDIFEAHGEGDNTAEIVEAKNRALAASGLTEADATRMAVGQEYQHGDYSDLLPQAFTSEAAPTEVPLETQASSTDIVPGSVPVETSLALTPEQIRQQEIMNAIDPRYYAAAGAVIAAYVGGNLARDHLIEYLADEDKKKLKKKKS